MFECRMSESLRDFLKALQTTTATKRHQIPCLSVCRPAREPKTGKPPTVLPRVLSGVLSEIGVLSRVLPRVLWTVLFLLFSTEEPLESTLGRSTCESTPISESTAESTLGSTFGGFPVLGSLAGRQTLDPMRLRQRLVSFCF